jgi:hypothetical protein
VLRIQDVYPGSRIQIFSIPDLGSRVKKIPDPGSGYASNLSIFIPKNYYLSSRKYGIPDQDLVFLPVPDPGIKKAPDPESGTATLIKAFRKNVGIVTIWLKREVFRILIH